MEGKIYLKGIGDTRARRVGNQVLVCIDDILEAFGVATPARNITSRTETMILATERDGRRVLHFVDVPSAACLVAQLRGKPPQRQRVAIAAMIDMQAKAMATPGQDLPEPGRVPFRAMDREPRPPGDTVASMARRLGLAGKISITAAGTFVAKHYRGGEGIRWPGGGMIYEDEAQLAHLLTQYARLHS